LLCSPTRPAIPRVNTLEAKDFLVNQTAQQAAIDGVPLSDLEKRMMYFSESDDSCEDPIALNTEFEAQYNSEEYEPKIARLLKNAYSQIRKENQDQKRNWDEAIRVLQKGDHYILVLWDISPPSEHPTRDFFKHMGIGVLIAILIAIGIIVVTVLRGK
jgi:hypothetical protein